MKINLFYECGKNTGGWAVYTAHLYHALKSTGCEVEILKAGMGRTNRNKSFQYGLPMSYIKNVDLPDQCKDSINLIVASDKHCADDVALLINTYNARIVIHDPNELKHAKYDIKSIKSPIVIRERVRNLIPGSIFIKHPYVRKYSSEQSLSKLERPALAVCTSRIDYDKNIHMVLDANRYLAAKYWNKSYEDVCEEFSDTKHTKLPPSDTQYEQFCIEHEKLVEKMSSVPINKIISIVGSENNRLYSHYKFLAPRAYLEWKQGMRGFPLEFGAGAEMCNTARFMVDMSTIKNDGDGTQYTFLEAFDAGSICVLNKDWIRTDSGLMRHGVNCLVAGSGKEVADILLSSDNNLEEIRQEANNILLDHEFHNIGRQVLNELTRI